MTSSKRAAANKANAQRSTGPRTADGKARSRVNALQHGLSVPVSARPDLAPDVAKLARLIAGNSEYEPLVLAAKRVAEASIDVLRIRLARAALLDRLLHNPGVVQASIEEILPDRPRPVLFRTATAVRMIREGRLEEMIEFEYAQLKREFAYEAAVKRIKQQRATARQRAQQSARDWKQLETLDRYERRSLSQRNTAVKALDAIQLTCHRESH